MLGQRMKGSHGRGNSELEERLLAAEQVSASRETRDTLCSVRSTAQEGLLVSHWLPQTGNLSEHKKENDVLGMHQAWLSGRTQPHPKRML